MSTTPIARAFICAASGAEVRLLGEQTDGHFHVQCIITGTGGPPSRLFETVLELHSDDSRAPDSGIDWDSENDPLMQQEVELKFQVLPADSNRSLYVVWIAQVTSSTVEIQTRTLVGEPIALISFRLYLGTAGEVLSVNQLGSWTSSLL